MLAEQMESKLDGLSQSSLRLLNADFHHREYLRVTNLDSIRREAAQVQKDLEGQPAKVQEINKKRIEILNKRMEKFEKVKENCQVIEAQCSAIEDVLQLLRDQPLTIRHPHQITHHPAPLLKDVQHTAHTV